MASADSTADDNLLSFAKIAAMPPQNSQASLVPHDDGSQPAQPHACPDSQGCGAMLADQDRPGNAQHDVNAVNRDVDRLSQAVQSVHLAGRKGRENTDVSGDAQENGVLKRETSFEEDRTHLSNSSTKPTSFDSKSMASVTTFAMDEKDSLRPDDSASVQAIDEEESLSGPASGAPNSLTGSESGGRGIRDHVRDVTIQRPRVILQHQGPVMHDGNSRTNDAIPPDSVANNFVITNPEPLPDAGSIHGFPHEPDEKLLEAMKSPKDRLLILQLEDKVRHFIQKSKEQSLELPPSNAFGRLLAHKLGDYYHLTHFVDNNVTSVRLHRTPFCRLPTPLSALHAANNTTPPPTMPTMKIMRRTEGERPPTDGSTAASSSVPSKTASEAGDGNDWDRTGSSGGTPAKDRLILTREEREAKYHEVRERIFRDFPESRSSDNSNGEQGNISRSSSASGRKKTHRQKTPHDDSFEVRSQYNAYYPGMHYTNGPVPYQVAMNDPGLPNQPPFMVGPGAAPPGTAYTPNPQNGSVYPGPMNTVPQYPMASPTMPPAGWQGGNIPQQPPFSGYASMGQPAMVNQPAKSPPTLNNFAMANPIQYQHPTNWSPSPYHGNFPQSPRNPAPAQWNYPNPSQPVGTSATSYPYAQVPGQLIPGMQNSAHPLPGSFNRSVFNPQTRSFVPSGPLTRHASRGSHGMSPSYQGMPGPPQWTGFDASRGPEPGYSGHYAGRGIPLGNRDSIAKWGTPSHLPPKPPPSQVPTDFAKHRNVSLPTAYEGAVHSKNGPFVVSGGSSQPKPNQQM